MIVLIIGIIICLIGYAGLAWCAYRVKTHKSYRAEQRVIANDIFWATLAVSLGSLMVGSIIGR